MKIKNLSILTFIVLWATSCSNETNEIPETSADFNAERMSTRSCVMDAVYTPTCLTATPELIKLKEMYDKQQSKKFKTKLLAVSASDYFSSNMYAIRELPVTIKVKSVASGSSNSNLYFYCTGVGEEVTLSNTATNYASKFYIKILPATTGIPYLIYSNASKTPLSVGYYTNNPNNKILMSSKSDSGSLFSVGWDLIPSSTYKGYFTIQSESYLGQSNPNNSMSVFYYVLEAQANNKIGYAQMVSNKTQQKFQIIPDAKFELQSIDYDLSSANISTGGYVTKVQTQSNTSVENKKLNFIFNFNVLENSYFSQDNGKITVNVNNETRKYARPYVNGGDVMLPDDNAKEDATYKTSSSQNINRQINYTLPITADPKSNYIVTVKFKYYNVSINYTVKARFTTRNGDIREFTFTGKWIGKIYENPNVLAPEYTYTKKAIGGDGDIILSKHLSKK